MIECHGDWVECETGGLSEIPVNKQNPFPRAIETAYAGCRFRSRTEARWAVFFDAMGFPWEYEKEGYELPSGRYLPDFYVGGMLAGFPYIWLEIKGKPPTEKELKLLAELAAHTNIIACMAVGIPGTAKFIGILAGENNTFSTLFNKEFELSGYGCDHFQKAIKAARSARFEFGENG